MLIVLHCGRPAGVTLSQWAPPSALRWIRPSSDPAHS